MAIVHSVENLENKSMKKKKKLQPLDLKITTFLLLGLFY